MKYIQLVCSCIFVLVVPSLRAQTAGAPVDATSVWNVLQSPAMDPTKSATTENVEIVRDRIHITLKSGTIQFAQPVNGVVFGAVFRGEGRLQAEPPNPIEAQQLRLLTKQDKLDMTFTEATFSFTDGLLDEVGKQVKWIPGGSVDDLYAKRQHDRENLGAAQLPRLFQSVLSGDSKRTAYFLTDLHTKEKGWVEVFDDAMNEEEITVGRWADIGPMKRFDAWMSFPADGRSSADAWKDPEAKADFLIRAYNIDATVTSGAELHADARVTIEPRLAGERILLFELDSNLRVESVADGQGKPVNFYQAREVKDRYQSYGDYLAVVLPAPFSVGQTQMLEFRYGGKRAIRKAGNGNYFCESSGWYPERSNSFATRADFELTFHAPKNLVLVATGDKTSETKDGNTIVTTWKSPIPLAVAGFAYGDFKVYNNQAGSVAIDVYANREPDEVMMMVQRAFENRLLEGSVGGLTPLSMAKAMGTEMANTVRVFESYFGPYPYKHLSVTSLPISYSYGQGWPSLIYLWSASFLDTTQRHFIFEKVDETGITDAFRAHECSHQWWGHRVGWKSYHDQWLSEGFADFSGILYVQYRENWKEALLKWRKEKEHLRNKDEKGHVIESLGPIWLGQRIASSETGGGSYQDLIYSKGAYVLYMLRMMLYDTLSPDPDHDFKELMQDYCRTFENKPASTEDFAAVVARHMIRTMDLDRNHKMDWFFNQYVYGTGVPEYRLSYTKEPAGDGKIKLSGTLTRSGVPDTWKDVVALYAHQGQNVTRMGFIIATQAVTPFEATLPASFDRFSINDNEDLLADVKQ